jgi:hypothetical protein
MFFQLQRVGAPVAPVLLRCLTIAAPDSSVSKLGGVPGLKQAVERTVYSLEDTGYGTLPGESLNRPALRALRPEA